LRGVFPNKLVLFA